MITLKNVKTIDGSVITHTVASQTNETLDAEGKLTIMPALIDPHVHFGIPGPVYDEDWKSGAKAALAGGVTTVFDMPDNSPPCCTKKSLLAKKQEIDKQLAEIKIPLRYYLYFGAHQDHLEEIPSVKDLVIGIKVFMGSSKENLIMQNDAAYERVFQLAAQQNIIVSVHAEDERLLKKKELKFGFQTDPAFQSKIHDREVAIAATSRVIELAERYNTQVFILNVSTKEEMALIRDAKRGELLVYAEVTPNHLFLSEEDYIKLGTKALICPPLRTKKDQEALWEAIHDGTVDAIGSDHAPYSLEKKKLPYGQAPLGVPGIETTLPLLLNAYHEKKIRLEQIVTLTRINIENIFSLDPTSDVVLVDLEKEQVVENDQLKSQSGWSPFAGKTLKGWPAYTVLRENLFKI